MVKAQTQRSMLAGLKPPKPKLILWVLLSAVLVGGATISSVANITRRKAPAIALSVLQNEPVALAAAAERQFAASQSPSSLARVDRLVREAVRQQPLHPVALRLFGYSADITGKPLAARKSIALAARLSRRDFGTQLWLIEAAVRDGDNKKALVHYDIALRTTTASQPILFPTLTDALADKAIRDALVPYVKKRPNWMSSFLYEAIATTDSPENLAALMRSAGKFSYTGNFSRVPDALLSRLAAKARFAAFQDYYLSLPKTSRATLVGVSLDRSTVGLPYVPAGWQIAEAEGVGGSFASGSQSGQSRLDGFASSGERGTVMSKYLFLKPGRYRLTALHRALETAPDASIEWTVQCVIDERKSTPVGNAAIPVTEGRFAAEIDFAISSACPAQMIVLQAAGGSAQGGAEFSVERIDLKPI